MNLGTLIIALFIALVVFDRQRPKNPPHCF